MTAIPEKMCTRCQYCLDHWGAQTVYPQRWGCQHPSRPRSPVNGWTEERPCAEAREDSADCGPEAKWYQEYVQRTYDPPPPKPREGFWKWFG